MSEPQPGIFALGTASHAYLEFDLVPGADPTAAVSRVAAMREPRTTIGGANLVTGFRPELWASVAGSVAPDRVTGFNEAIVGPSGYTLPATQHDVVVWLTGPAYDVVFDLSRAVLRELRPYGRLANEIVGWPYHRDLDLTGFIDGTENPTIVEAMSVALIPEGTRGAGASILLLQQWDHDVTAWESQPTEAQEAIIGRRKADSEELDPKPDTSHVGRTDQDTFGKIFRRNIPYGNVTDHGTTFVGFCAAQAPLARMLDSMIGRSSGAMDALTRFTKALTGAYYVIPAADDLAGFAVDDRTEAPTP